MWHFISARSRYEVSLRRAYVLISA